MSQLFKKILILGAKGMLGSDIVKILSDDYDVTPMDIAEVDITKKDTVEEAINRVKPDIVINCSAYTDVDGCESHTEEAFLVNAEGVKNIAECCRSINAKLIHYSTDYIFDGEKPLPYTENDLPNPLNIYGESKLQGEKYVQEIMEDWLIIRSSWLFGKNGKNFVTAILKLTEEKEELKIVNDQVGSPTHTVDLAQATGELVSRDIRGVFNITNSNYCSWYEFAKTILNFLNINHVKIIPISSEELSRPAKRPKNSILDCNKFHRLAEFEMPHWEVALKKYLASQDFSNFMKRIG